MKFRKDINGLRAIAVLAVVLFHFKIVGFTGGFSGVDIFFVISGYLMTNIIFSRIESQHFSLIDFYLHRARRIIPALAVLCLFFIIAGYFFLLTPDYRELMQIVRKVILFVSNFKFYEETNYFATAAQENWLLHTWSLSVEWQFYLIYPIIILGLAKVFNLSIVKKILIALAIISFGYSVFYTPINPSAAFYLLPTRAWEMLAGGLVFLYPVNLKNLTQKIIVWLGLFIILVSILCLTDKAWPGYLAIIPIIGSVLVLYGIQGNFILNNPLSQGLGKISYSVYLWHWPIAVFLYITGYLASVVCLIVGILLSFILGTLSYFFVERRVTLKRGKIFELIKYFAIVGLTIGLAAFMGSFVKHNKYARNNMFFSDNFRLVDNLATVKNKEITKRCLLDDHYFSPFPECKDGQGPINLIVIGDSHAGMLFPTVQEINTKGSTLYWANMACPIIEGVHFSSGLRASCESFIEEKVGLLKEKYLGVPVIFINFLNPYFKEKPPSIYFNTPADTTESLKQQYRTAYVKMMCDIAKVRPVYILRPVPSPDYNVPKKMAISLMMGGSLSLTSTFEKYQEENQFVIEVMEQAKKECGVTLLDPVPYFCPNGKQCFSAKDGKPLYFDNNHLSRYGAEFIKPLFEKVLDQQP